MIPETPILELENDMLWLIIICDRPNPLTLVIPTITDDNDFAPNSVWMRSRQGMGVEKVLKDDTARTFENW